MKYRKLGNTDIDVSVICLGTMTFGEQNTEAEAHEQLDYATSQGVNFIDTAEMYPVPPIAKTQGLTEQYIGSWLAKRNDRDQFIIATKVCARQSGFVSHIRNGPRLNREHMTKALENSLQRLQTDYIDLYQLHWPERSTNFFGQLGYIHQEDDDIALEETFSVLKEFVDSGKVRHVGLSNETPWGVMKSLQLADNMNMPRVMSIQNPYNLLNRTYEIGLAEVSHREQTGLLAYSPLGFGVLSGKYLNGQKPENARLTLWERFGRYTNPIATKATEEYAKLAEHHGLSLTQMALAFVNSRPFLTSNIIGATNLEQLQENIASVDLELNEYVLKGIEKIHELYPNPCP